MARKKTKWQDLKDEYILAEPHISLNELSKRHNVSVQSIAYHSRKENWMKAREDYYNAISKKTRDLRVLHKSQEKVSQLEQVESAFHGLMSSIEAINKRIERADFGRKIDKLEIAKLMERQASLSTALDKVGRLIQLLEGNADSRQSFDLASILSTNRDSTIGDNVTE